MGFYILNKQNKSNMNMSAAPKEPLMGDQASEEKCCGCVPLVLGFKILFVLNTLSFIGNFIQWIGWLGNDGFSVAPVYMVIMLLGYGAQGFTCFLQFKWFREDTTETREGYVKSIKIAMAAVVVMLIVMMIWIGAIVNAGQTATEPATTGNAAADAAAKS